MLAQFFQFDLLTLFLDDLRFLLLYWVSIVEPVISVISVDMVTSFWGGLAVVVNFEVSTLDLLSIHLNESLLSAIVVLELNVGEPFRFFGLPIDSDANAFNLTKSSEPVTNIILFEGIG